MGSQLPVIPIGDAEGMRAKARWLLAKAPLVRELSDAVQHQVAALPYAGPAADAFHHSMALHRREALRIADDMEAAGRRMLAAASALETEQDAVRRALLLAGTAI